MMNYQESDAQSFKTRRTTFLQKYGHSFLLLYFLIYFPWFTYLEKTVTNRFHVIHMAVDDQIPFIEYFIIPYLLWFAYVAAAIVFFLFKNKTEYYRLCAFLFIGMTVFLVISTVYPNGHYLRPAVFERDNIFTAMVQNLYQTDTPTNLFPSIHVYNSIGVNIAVWHCEEFKNSRIIRYGSAALMISIVLSTMFLKQHSVFDVITGIVFAIFMYTFVYSWNSLRAGKAETSLEERLKRI